MVRYWFVIQYELWKIATVVESISSQKMYETKESIIDQWHNGFNQTLWTIAVDGLQVGLLFNYLKNKTIICLLQIF